MIRMLIFDLDGTLARKFGVRLLPGVAAFFRLLWEGGCPDPPQVAIATNQGGVGLRYWMETQGFGRPAGYPTQAAVEQRLERVLANLGRPIPVYVSYRYRNSQGETGPVPPGLSGDLRWSEDWRKPRPGMLLHAMTTAGALPAETLFVGDSPEDQAAARAAGCRFRWARPFFSQDRATCERLREDLEQTGD